MWQQDTQAVSSSFFTPDVMIYVIFPGICNFQKCFYSQVILNTLSLDLAEYFSISGVGIGGRGRGGGEAEAI